MLGYRGDQAAKPGADSRLADRVKIGQEPLGRPHDWLALTAGEHGRLEPIAGGRDRQLKGRADPQEGRNGDTVCTRLVPVDLLLADPDRLTYDARREAQGQPASAQPLTDLRVQRIEPAPAARRPALAPVG